MRSKLITTSTQIATDKVNILGYQIFPDGTNAASLVLYNEADSGKTTTKRVSAGRVVATESKEVCFDEPLVCDAGLYVD